jgi:hypothetical protein
MRSDRFSVYPSCVDVERLTEFSGSPAHVGGTIAYRELKGSPRLAMSLPQLSPVL